MLTTAGRAQQLAISFPALSPPLLLMLLLLLLLLLMTPYSRGAPRRPPNLSPRLRDPPILSDTGRPPTYLDGDAWTAHSCGGGAIPSTVPGDLVSDLARAGIIGDPVHGVNWRDQSGAWAHEGGGLRADVDLDGGSVLLLV